VWHRLRGILRPTVDSANLRRAAVFFGWLAGAVAFASVFPLWLTISLASAALATDLVRRSQNRRRAGGIAAVSVVLVTGCAFVLAAADRPSGSRPEEGWVALGRGLASRLTVENEMWGKHWKTRIQADGTDRLRFRLVIRNRNSFRSPPLIARLYASPDKSAPRHVAINLAEQEYGPFVSGPQVAIWPQSGGLHTFHHGSMRLEEVGQPHELLDHPSYAPGNARGEEAGSGTEWVIPPIAPRSALPAEFTATYVTPQSSGIGGGPIVEAKRLGPDDNAYEQVTAARPGERVEVAMRFHDPGFRGTDVFTRLQIVGGPRSDYARIRVFINGSARALGFGTINSKDGTPVRLSIEPGSTELVRIGTECAPELRKHLPDGIAHSGVELGEVGGFEPRDRCHDEQFVRFVLFKARVLSANGGLADHGT